MVIGVDASRAFVPDKTGTETYSFQLLKHMLVLPAAKSHDWVIFTRGISSRSLRRKYSWMKGSHVQVVEVKMSRLWTQIGLAVATWRSYPDVGQLDVLWVPAHTLPILRNPRVRSVVTIHGLEYEWLPEYKNLLQRWYLPLSTKYAVLSSDILLAVSTYTKDQIITRLGALPEKIMVVSEGVDVKFFSKKRTESRKREVLERYGITSPYLLFVGSLQPRKNLPYLVSVYSRLRKIHPNLQLVIAGTRGWLFDEILTAPKRYGVENSVIFPGRVDDETYAILLQGAVLYLQPSLTEGFGLPTLEAMAAGCPVAVSSGGALPEVVGDAGLVLSGSTDSLFDKSEWVRKISKVLNSRLQRARMKRAGREWASAHTWRKSAKTTLDKLVN